MKIVNIVSWVAAVGIAAGLAVVMPAFAQTNVGVGVGMQGGIHNGANGGSWQGGMPGGGVFGTVSAISVNGDANTFDITAYARPMRPMPEQSQSSVTPVSQASTTIYTVDATNATIYKGSATTTVSVGDIAVGDKVIVQGTVTGTSIAATVIRDGVFPAPGMGGRRFFGRGASSTPSGTSPIQGNGEPVVGGSVTNVSGTIITVTNASNVTYTIDAASTTIIKNGTSTTIGDIALGDNLIVQGTVNGNSVTASSIIDQGVRTSSTNASSSASHGNGGLGFGGAIGGFFGAIGGFFQHLFGF